MGVHCLLRTGSVLIGGSGPPSDETASAQSSHLSNRLTATRQKEPRQASQSPQKWQHPTGHVPLCPTLGEHVCIEYFEQLFSKLGLSHCIIQMCIFEFSTSGRFPTIARKMNKIEFSSCLGSPQTQSILEHKPENRSQVRVLDSGRSTQAKRLRLRSCELPCFPVHVCEMLTISNMLEYCMYLAPSRPK